MASWQAARKGVKRENRAREGTIKLSAFITLHGFIEDIKENTFQRSPINYYVCCHRVAGERSEEARRRVKVDEGRERSFLFSHKRLFEQAIPRQH